MNIYYSFELFETEKEKYDSNPQLYELMMEPDVMNFFKEFRDFIVQRLRVLEDEINAEESKKTCCVIINFPNKDIPDSKIGYAGYSNGLTMKMLSCFTKQDNEYIQNEILRRYPSLNIPN